jgi:hypothetical protein
MWVPSVTCLPTWIAAGGHLLQNVANIKAAFHSFEERVEQRFTRLEERVDQKFNFLEGSVQANNTCKELWARALYTS